MHQNKILPSTNKIHHDTKTIHHNTDKLHQRVPLFKVYCIQVLKIVFPPVLSSGTVLVWRTTYQRSYLYRRHLDMSLSVTRDLHTAFALKKVLGLYSSYTSTVFHRHMSVYTPTSGPTHSTCHRLLRKQNSVILQVAERVV